MKPLRQPILSAAAAATTGLVLLGANHLGTRVRDRLGRPSPFMASPVTRRCAPDRTDYPVGHLILPDADGTRLGPCLTVLRGRYLGVTGTGLSEAEALLDDEFATADATDHVDYEDMLRSYVATILVLALDIARAEFGCTCGNDCDEDTDDEDETLYLVAGRAMTQFALGFESAAEEHTAYCRSCRRAGERAPGMLRARFCRDLAADLLTNFEHDHVHLHGVPLTAAFDVVCVLVDAIAVGHGEAPERQIAALTRGLAQAIAHSEGHGPFADDTNAQG